MTEHPELSEYQALLLGQSLRLTQIINESLILVRDSKRWATRLSRLRAAKEKLEELKKLCAQNPFLKIERLPEVENHISKFQAELSTQQPSYIVHGSTSDTYVEPHRIYGTLDFSCCPKCRALDGRSFPCGGGPRPPFHKGCRCVMVLLPPAEFPELEALFSGGERASCKGPVPRQWTYYEWLSHCGRGEIAEVLGPDMAALFLEGGLSAHQFTALLLTERYRPRTLRELSALIPDAFGQAGLQRYLPQS